MAATARVPAGATLALRRATRKARTTHATGLSSFTRTRCAVAIRPRAQAPKAEDVAAGLAEPAVLLESEAARDEQEASLLEADLKDAGLLR